MEKEIIYQIQKKVIDLLRRYNNKPLYIASADNCSEVVRIAGCWIFEKLPQTNIYILKGENVCDTKRSHDILVVEHNGNINLIDPTIWQFFKNKRSIFIKTTNNLANSLLEANNIYGGKWKISEKLETNNCKDNDFEKIIASNITK